MCVCVCVHVVCTLPQRSRYKHTYSACAPDSSHDTVHDAMTKKTHSELLFPGVGAERLWLQDQPTPGPEVSEYLAKHSTHTGITPIKVHPLGDAES